MPSVAISRSAGDVECSDAPPETADYRQAGYFLRLLAQRRLQIDHRMAEYHKAIAGAEAVGDTEGAGGLRRMARIEAQDLRTLDNLIENLHRRFPGRRPGGIPQGPRRARSPVH